MRALDLLIAEHVFGWTEIDNRMDGQGMSGQPPGDVYRRMVPFYSNNVVLAIGVLEKLRAGGWDWQIHTDQPTAEKQFWVQLFKDGGVHSWYAEPLPEAICRHVLRALKIEVPT